LKKKQPLREAPALHGARVRVRPLGVSDYKHFLNIQYYYVYDIKVQFCLQINYNIHVSIANFNERIEVRKLLAVIINFNQKKIITCYGPTTHTCQVLVTHE
jgi:hypothetical protein